MKNWRNHEWVKVALVSAVILTVLWISAPRRSSQLAKEVTEIVYMGGMGDVTGGGPLAGGTEDSVREFERRNPQYHIISGFAAMRDLNGDPQRFLTSVAGGSPPDVMFFDRFAVTEWAARGAFWPLNDFIDSDLQNDNPEVTQKLGEPINPKEFYPAAWDEGVYQGKVYGIPNQIDSRGLLYNKDLLVKKGLVDEKGQAKPPHTWDELKDYAVKLTERDAYGNIKVLGFAPNNLYGNSFLYIYGWMNGGEFMSSDGRTCTLNDPKIVAALQWVTNVYDALGGTKQVNAFELSSPGGDLDPFFYGKVAMRIDGNWAIQRIVSVKKDLNFGVAPPPMPSAELAKGRTPISWSGGFCYAIPSTSKHPEAAWKLVRWLSSVHSNLIAQGVAAHSNESQGRVFFPPIHPNKRVYQAIRERFVENNPNLTPQLIANMRTFDDLLPACRYRPVTPVGQLLFNQQLQALENAIRHKMTPQQALDNGTKIVQRDLDRVLHPPSGLIMRWKYFFVLYAAILAAMAGGLYWWHLRTANERSYFRHQWSAGLICASPWIAGFVIFTGGPILFSIIISLCHYDILNPARFAGLENYRAMYTEDGLFLKSLFNTLFMVIGIPFGMVLSLALALLLNQKVRGMEVYRTLFFLPAIMPAVAASILWIWMFNPQSGMINLMLKTIHAIGPHWWQLQLAPNWLGDENTSKPALILMSLWSAGSGMIIWLAGLKSISESYYEAAALDGAGAWARFVYVTIPMLSPYILFNLVMGLIGTFQIFSQAYIMTQGGPVNSTLFYAYHLFNNAFRYLHMGYAAAMAWVLFAIVLVLTLAQMRLSKRWVHYEAE